MPLDGAIICDRAQTVGFPGLLAGVLDDVAAGQGMERKARMVSWWWTACVIGGLIRPARNEWSTKTLPVAG